MTYIHSMVQLLWHSNHLNVQAIFVNLIKYGATLPIAYMYFSYNICKKNTCIQTSALTENYLDFHFQLAS